MAAIGENEIRITVDLCIVDGTSHLECSCADIRRVLTGYRPFDPRR